MIAKSVSPQGLERIQSFEGFLAEPVALSDGRFVFGHGHVATVAKPVTRTDAAALLKSDLAPVERAVNALVSFASSIGVSAFAKSEALRRVNAGEFSAAGCAMDAWRKSAVSGQSEIVEALVRRRAQEKAMLVPAPAGVPSAWLAPELDHAAAILAAPVRVAPLPELAPCAFVAPSKPASSSKNFAPTEAFLQRAENFFRAAAAMLVASFRHAKPAPAAS